ncbi:hypothetical protein EVAR_90534_1 [Eumeta japonica]|uniref:Uncharacterized protein n=1 Tax=Eumeta variegata TaxID=151549 RepID=A0A4C1XYB8_EUMVA|nr:hypothetical protein EVAR_90534_1 [Eumeta japonica]
MGVHKQVLRDSYSFTAVRELIDSGSKGLRRLCYSSEDWELLISYNGWDCLLVTSAVTTRLHRFRPGGHRHSAKMKVDPIRYPHPTRFWLARCGCEIEVISRCFPSSLKQNEFETAQPLSSLIKDLEHHAADEPQVPDGVRGRRQQAGQPRASSAALHAATPHHLPKVRDNNHREINEV